MPELIVTDGCNGAGKSTFASSFLPEGMTSFDYDRVFIENYIGLEDSELREVIAINRTSEEFETAIERAIQNKLDFSDETNFDSHPLYWPKKYKDNGYIIHLIFFCPENQEIARHRIQVRTEFKGHFIDNKTIDLKWRSGYKNINNHFQFFDNILIVDNSKQNEIYTNLVQIEKGEFVLMIDQLPGYFSRRLPDLFAISDSR